MPIPETLCTNQDVFGLIGGEHRVAQLIDENGDGRVDEGIILGARKNATTEVLMSAGVQHETQVPMPYPRAWVLCAAWLALKGCWVSGTQGQAFPAKYAEEVENVRQNLLPKLRAGDADPVADNGTSLSQSVISMVPHNSAFTLEKMKGLW